MGVVIHQRANPTVPASVLEEMYRLRFQVFKERLGWNIDCPGHRDQDAYDLLDPVYGIYLGATGAVEGCWRLLATTGPYMLKDIFSQLLAGTAPPGDRQTWEISRFAVLGLSKGYESLAALSRITSELLTALFDFCLDAGIRRVVAASDVRFERILRRSRLIVHRFGPVCMIGATPAVAGWIDISEDHAWRVGAAMPEPRVARAPEPRLDPSVAAAGAGA